MQERRPCSWGSEEGGIGQKGGAQPDEPGGPPLRRGRSSIGSTALYRAASLAKITGQVPVSILRPPESAVPTVLDDRLTEQRNPRSARLHALDPRAFVRLLSDENREAVEAVARVEAPVARAIELATAALRDGGRLIWVGAGTSGRLAVLDAAEMPPTFGTDPEQVQGVIAGGHEALVRAREGAEDDPGAGAREMDALGVDRRDFVLGIATSGSTPFVHGAVDRARSRGATTGFLLCTPPDPGLEERHDVVIAPLTGPEVVTGSTRMKAGTATKLVLNAISTGAMVQMGKVWGNLMVDLQVTCQKLEDRGLRILRTALGVDEDGARALLEAADGQLRTALVMGRLGLDADDARARLSAVGGRVGDLLGTPPPEEG